MNKSKHMSKGVAPSGVPFYEGTCRVVEGGRIGVVVVPDVTVDAALINESNGFAILFEAKVLSDTSVDITYDTMRNQIIRNVDVMLEPGDGLLPPADRRRPDRSLFVLLTPELFRQRPHTRLYGWLMNEYRQNPDALARDLPHRASASWPRVARRMGWLTWEDCEAVRPGSCPWLTDAA